VRGLIVRRANARSLSSAAFRTTPTTNA